MIIFIVCCYFFIIFLALFFANGRSKSNTFIKVGHKRVHSILIKNQILFCSLSSRPFDIYKKITKSLFVFKKSKECFRCYHTLKDCGVDVSLPIFKYELYNKVIDYPKVYNFLKAVKNLDKKQVSFNLFIFVSSFKTLGKVERLIKYFNFKNVKVRLYNCCEIDYNILSSINTLDNNDDNKMANIGRLSFRNFDKNFLETTLDSCTKDGEYIVNKNQELTFQNFSYKNFYLYSYAQNNYLKASLTKTFDYENSLSLHKLVVTNISNTKQVFNFCFGNKLQDFLGKTAIYYAETSKNQFCVGEVIFQKLFKFFGEYSSLNCYKNCYIAKKEYALKPLESVTIFYATSNFNTTNISFAEIESRFNSCVSNFKNIKLPKVLTNQKTLNYLINEFLPNKIFEKVIASGNKYDEDFLSILNLKFEHKNIDSNFLKPNLNRYFLISKNFFKCYFNLFYFYFGLWKDALGINFNPDKTYICSKATILFLFNEQILRLELENKNLKNEIKLNDIKFSNLSYLKLTENNKDSINLQF